MPLPGDLPYSVHCVVEGRISRGPDDLIISVVVPSVETSESRAPGTVLADITPATRSGRPLPLRASDMRLTSAKSWELNP